jgi:hypothetical protein
MTLSALTAFLTSLGIFMVLLVLLKLERDRRRRLIATRLRSFLDTLVERSTRRLETIVRHFLRYIVQLHWYYGIHSILRALLRGMVALYTYLETVFERNRARTKLLRAEKRQLHELNHLRQMAEHREETALTPSQQQKLRHRKLEGKD